MYSVGLSIEKSVFKASVMSRIAFFAVKFTEIALAVLIEMTLLYRNILITTLLRPGYIFGSPATSALPFDLSSCLLPYLTV